MSDILSRTSWRTSRLPACSWSDRGRASDHAGVQRVRDRETMAFFLMHARLIDGVMATNNNCPQECATSTGAHSCGQ